MKRIIEKIRNISIIQKYPHLRQFIKFFITGGICTILDFAVYIFLTRLFPFFRIHYLWANFFGTVVGATVNFTMNKKWTFRNEEVGIFRQYMKFWVVVIIGLAIYQYLFGFLVEKINLYDLLGKAISALIVMFIRFYLNKFWVFNFKKL